MRNLCLSGANTSAALVRAGLDDAGPDNVRLLDDQTYETVDRYQLDPNELACSICSTSFADDPAVYYVVGTALTEPEESEPNKASCRDWGPGCRHMLLRGSLTIACAACRAASWCSACGTASCTLLQRRR